MTIEEQHWRSLIALASQKSGPLAISAGKEYFAQYMKAVFRPGMTAPVHGSELVSARGETCLETSEVVDLYPPV